MHQFREPWLVLVAPHCEQDLHLELALVPQMLKFVKHASTLLKIKALLPASILVRKSRTLTMHCTYRAKCCMIWLHLPSSTLKTMALARLPKTSRSGSFAESNIAWLLLLIVSGLFKFKVIRSMNK